MKVIAHRFFVLWILLFCVTANSELQAQSDFKVTLLGTGTPGPSIDPKIKARLADLGGSPLVLSPAAFGKVIADDVEKWGKVVRVANIKPE